jgi:hemerythrin-like domain-containing protein
MKATKILMDEHRVIERVLDALEATADRLDQGETIDPAFFLDAAEFIRGFADGCHHHKEEGVLFVAMNAAGMPTEAGPIGVMLAEHEQARALTRALREGAARMKSGDRAAAAQVLNAARGYVRLLRQHIQKEDRILFPMADQIIPTAQHARVEEEFDRVEREESGADAHTKYHALAEQLERVARG